MHTGTDSHTCKNIYTHLHSHGHYTCKMHLLKLLLRALLKIGVGWYITFLVVLFFDWIDLCSSQEAQWHRPQPQLPRQPFGGPQNPAVAGEPEAGGEGPQHWVSCFPWIIMGGGGGHSVIYFPGGVKSKVACRVVQFWWGGGGCQDWVSCLPWIICGCEVLSCSFPWSSEKQSCLLCQCKLLFHFVTKKQQQNLKRHGA